MFDLTLTKKPSMIFSRSYYEDMKAFFHPNVHRYIEKTAHPSDDLIYLLPYHACGWKTRRGRKKSILYRNGSPCIFTGNFHPGKMNVWKFQPLVQFTRYMSFVGEMVKFLYKCKGDYIYNFNTTKYIHLSETPMRDRYERFLNAKNVYLNKHRQL